MSKIDDDLINGCERFLEEMKRVDLEKEQKKEAARKASEEREAKRNHWAKVLYSGKRQGMTLIIPEESEIIK